MKLICPYCQRAGVPEKAARRSRRERPAVCDACGGLSHVSGRVTLTILVGSIGVSLIVLMVAAAFQSWGIAVSAVCMAVAYFIWAWQHVKLSKQDEADSSTSSL